MHGNCKLQQEIWSDNTLKKDKSKKEKFKSKDSKSLLMILKNKKDFFFKINKAILLFHQDSKKINKNNLKDKIFSNTNLFLV